MLALSAHQADVWTDTNYALAKLAAIHMPL